MIDYEKAYNDALERAKQSLKEADHIEYNMEQSAFDIRKTVYDIFPELAESEDERIRKELWGYFHNLQLSSDSEFSPSLTFDDILAYLEKQKEQKPSTPQDIAAAYQMGLSEGRKEQKPLSTEETELNSIAFLEQMGYTCIPPKEQKPAEWSENFEENIRNLLHDKLTWRSEDGSMSSAVFIDDKTLKDIISGIWFYVGKEALKYPNKELSQPEWSEEDELMRDAVLNTLERIGDYGTIGMQKDWIKSLRHRPH